MKYMIHAKQPFQKPLPLCENDPFSSRCNKKWNGRLKELIQLVSRYRHSPVCSGCWRSKVGAHCNSAPLHPLVWQCWGRKSSSRGEGAQALVLVGGLWIQGGQHSGALGTGPGPTLETRHRKGVRSWGRESRQTELHPAAEHNTTGTG